MYLFNGRFNRYLSPGDGGSGDGGDEGGKGKDKTFTQEDLDRLIAERLKREREKYADYDDLKGKAKKLEEIENASKTEAEKLAKERDELKKRIEEQEKAIKARDLLSLKEKHLESAGLPRDLASRVMGEDEEAIKKDVEALKKYVATAPKKVGGDGTPPGDTKNKGEGEPGTLKSAIASFYGKKD